MLNNPKWNEPNLTDFIDWLGTQDSKKSYDYSDTCGGCLMGQYMTAKGIEWSPPMGISSSLASYHDTCGKVFSGPNLWVLTDCPRTFGAARERAIRFSDSVAA
jgi:hypothetical protein